MNNFKLIMQKATQDIRRYVDVLALAVSAYLSALLVFRNFAITEGGTRLPAIPFFVGLSYFVLFSFVMRERNWRMVSAYDAIRLCKAVFTCTVMFVAVCFVVGGNSQFIQWVFCNGLLSLSLLCGVRLSRRLIFEHKNRQMNARGRRTLVIGTGIAGCSLASRFTQDSSIDLRLIGFLTYDPKVVGARISGIAVLGLLKSFSDILVSHSVQEVIITESPDSGEQLRELLQQAQNHGIKPKMMTHLNFSDKSKLGNETLRDIALSDLLRRPRVEVDLRSTKILVEGQTLMVTGAGGSIGSELVRQLTRMGPKRILLIDQAEFNLYAIDSELKALGLGIETVPILSDLKETEILRKIMDEYSPSVVFHAAAYKHVHLVEANANAAILNNLESTKNLVDACIEHRVGRFVMISSDKAVNPRGVMGATKRACEIIVTHAGETENLPYCSVRFGNVLGSSGSFIPLLTKQIQMGGPVTITHPDMERYFMLIPEAVSLVLKTLSISKPGDINLLKMGEAIKIVDIAKSLMLLLGKKEDEIPLIFTGTRPGEKLREELYLLGDEIETQHPDIVVLPKGGKALGSGPVLGSVAVAIQNVIQSARSGSDEAGPLLYRLIENKDLNFIEGKTGKENDNEKRPGLVA